VDGAFSPPPQSSFLSGLTLFLCFRQWGLDFSPSSFPAGSLEPEFWVPPPWTEHPGCAMRHFNATLSTIWLQTCIFRRTSVFLLVCIPIPWGPCGLVGDGCRFHAPISLFPFPAPDSSGMETSFNGPLLPKPLNRSNYWLIFGFCLVLCGGLPLGEPKLPVVLQSRGGEVQRPRRSFSSVAGVPETFVFLGTCASFFGGRGIPFPLPRCCLDFSPHPPDFGLGTPGGLSTRCMTLMVCLGSQNLFFLLLSELLSCVGASICFLVKKSFLA